MKKMNVLGTSTECSSGCESGWTLYLDQSFHSPNAAFSHHTGYCKKEEEEEEEEEEEDDDTQDDLSMVSDASSGPPHFNEDERYFNNENLCFFPAASSKPVIELGKNRGKRQKMKELEDDIDTGSSSVFSFSKGSENFCQKYFSPNSIQASMESVLHFPQGLSAAHLEERAPLEGTMDSQ